MAIIFHPSQKKHKFFLPLMMFLLIVVLYSIGFFILSYQSIFFENNPQPMPSIPILNINLGILDSNQVKNLEPFSSTIELQFFFIAKDQKGEEVSGTISAINVDQARNLLEQQGLMVISLQEAIGKDQPFIPYYQK